MVHEHTTTQIVAKEGMPLVFGLWSLTLLILLFGESFFAKLFLLGLSAAVFYIFRNPERVPMERGAKVLMAPADGRITSILKVTEGPFCNEERLLVSIETSLFNVPIIRSAVSGVVEEAIVKKGAFLPQTQVLAKKLNERALLLIRMDDETRILLKLVSGSFGNKIGLYPKKEQRIEAGERIGFMIDGLVELYLPLSARIKVGLGDEVRAGESILGYLA